MSKTQFTKGQWLLKKNAFHPRYEIISCERENYIGSVNLEKYNCDIPETEAEANAYLIIAAPDLFKELQNMVEVFSNIMSNDAVWARSSALKALAKARGES